MAIFSCSGFRNATADSASDAARMFAARQARKDFGRKGYCRTLRLDSWTENGLTHHFESFIGYSVGGGTTSGRSEFLSVHEVA